MADGVTVASGNNTSPPNNTKFATDDLGAAGHLPLVALAYSDSSGTMVTADSNGLEVQISTGTVTISGVTSSSASTTSTADTGSSTQLIASNASRVGFSITNTSSGILYVKFGSGATTTSFVKRLSQNEQVGSQQLGLYTGAIYGIWATDPNDGSAICTEW